MTGNIIAGAAVTVNPPSSIGNFFSVTIRENVSKFFSTWSGRGMEHIQNISVKMQKSNYKAIHIFAAVNLSFLCVVKYAIHPFLERLLAEKNEDTKRKCLAKRLTKVLVVGAILTAANFAFAKLVKYPLNNFVLFTTVAAALIGYLVLIKPISIHKPETPEQRAERAARLNAEATRLEGEATTAETAARETAATLANRIAEQTTAADRATRAREELNNARTQNLRAEETLQQARDREQTAGQKSVERADEAARALTALGEAQEALRDEEGRTQNLADLRDALRFAVEALAEREAELRTARGTEATHRAELRFAEENQVAPHNTTEDAALEKAVAAAQQAREQAEAQIQAAVEERNAARAPLKAVLDAANRAENARRSSEKAAQQALAAELALNAASQRAEAAQDAVNNPVDLAPLQEAERVAVLARNDAAEAVRIATDANDTAQEAARAARASATAARAAAEAATLPAVPATS